MPRLLIFAPCEKVIIDHRSNTISLITVLEELRYKTPPGAVVPPNTFIPMRWSVVTLWQEEEPADAGVQFEQRFILSDGVRSLIENVARWTFSTPTQRIVTEALQFPISGTRSLVVHLSYRVTGATDWVSVASFPLRVIQEIM